MEPYQEILVEYFADLVLQNRPIDAQKIVEGQCFRAICKIRDILSDSTLEDDTCFLKIEEIVCTLEDIGLDAGGRHDFG